MRACIECVQSGQRYYVCLVWMEEYPSTPFGKKYLRGKLVYQREPGEGRYYVRPYGIQGSSLVIPPGAALEEAVEAVLPPDRIKLGCTGSGSPLEAGVMAALSAMRAREEAARTTEDGTILTPQLLSAVLNRRGL